MIGVTRIGKKLPEGGLQLRVGLGSTMSVAFAVYETVAPPTSSASTVKSAGTVRLGGVVS